MSDESKASEATAPQSTSEGSKAGSVVLTQPTSVGKATTIEITVKAQTVTTTTLVLGEAS